MAKALRLFFLRHGEAGSRSAWTGDDAERPLTEEGREQVRRVARALAPIGVEPELIITSPYARAAETARITAEVLGLADRVIFEPGLSPESPVTELPPVVWANPDLSALMLVGHEPHLGSLITSICGGGRIALRKAGLAEVRFERAAGAKGVLVLLVQAHQLCV
jgi:phosphohistidine phosphatase